MKPTLFLLAAGMGSRYGGLKQLDGLGPNGETDAYACPQSYLFRESFQTKLRIRTCLVLAQQPDVTRIQESSSPNALEDTERSGYYNVTGAFFKNLGIHFAIGYPF